MRKLSLFDTLSSENPDPKFDTNSDLVKSEPVLNTDNQISENKEFSKVNQTMEKSENEFNPENSDISDLENDFNQETEEELLDIPTFLRRQAN